MKISNPWPKPLGLATLVLSLQGACPASAQDGSVGLLPDFQTVVIKHVHIQNEHGRFVAV